MLIGWRQWADAGSVSSGLPQYLVELTGARQIGTIKQDGFYLFQVPGTHDLVRPVVKFEDGYPYALDAQRNELYYTGDQEHGIVIFLGDEPHLDAERYVAALLDVAKELNVKRIIGLGGVYGVLPYDKERMVSCVYSLPQMKEAVSSLAVTLSDYEGGASIGSYVCRRAGERGLEYIGLYAFVPMYTLAQFGQEGGTIQIENDFAAWLGIMRRINYMLKLNLDLTELENKSRELVELMQTRVDELDRQEPELGLRETLQRLSDEFTEVPFNPLEDVWEEELRRLFDKLDPEE
jgi:proteasome assembly chaperone (PAC2) family protein